MTAVEMLGSELKLKTSAPTKTKPIVVASDGSDAALTALKVAGLIRSRTGCAVRVVSAVEPLPDVIPPFGGVVVPVDWEQVREKNQRDIITRQRNAIDTSEAWPVDIIVGRPCEMIAEYAREHDAGLIIVGSNKHGIIGRMFGEDTAVDIARLSEIPLLIATSAMTRLPKRVIVAMSLDPDGMQNTAETLSLISDAPSVSCVHVQPRDEFLGVDWAEFDNEYEFAMNERFAAVEKSFLTSGFQPDLILLHGNPAKEIVDFADYSKSELIVLDIRRKPGKPRAIGGRTARGIIRHAECSVLVVPNTLSVGRF